jgi:DNA-binding HxlR family transcriptional regulator
VSSDDNPHPHKDDARSGLIPHREAIRAITGKWKLEILWTLTKGALQFAELRRAVPGMSQGVLVKQLVELEADGLVKREKLEHTSRLVTYKATRAARGLAPVFEALIEWTNACPLSPLKMDPSLGYADALLPDRDDVVMGRFDSANIKAKGVRSRS